MARLLRTALCVTVTVVSAVLSAPHASAQEPSLQGLYLCVGAGPDGAPYTAFVELVEYEDTYRLRWIFPDTGESLIGMGVRKGDTLAVMYLGRDPGLVMYRVEADSTLVGTWTTVAAQGHTFAETLTRTDALPEGLPPGHPPADQAPGERPAAAAPVGLRAALTP